MAHHNVQLTQEVRQAERQTGDGRDGRIRDRQMRRKERETGEERGRQVMGETDR